MINPEEIVETNLQHDVFNNIYIHSDWRYVYRLLVCRVVLVF